MSLTTVVSISSFRNDEHVLALVREVAQHADCFAAVHVVDSLGHEGMAERVAEAAGSMPSQYWSADENLGAAGNLAERLVRAAEAGADAAYALNHDASFVPAAARKLLAVAARHTELAAVYPLRRLAALDYRYDLSGTSRWPWLSKARRHKPAGELLEVCWSSSNGALYRLAPTRAGILPWRALWHGQEDVDYGWQLGAAGYRQVMVLDAVVDDNYEYLSEGAVRLSDKPPWLTYYLARNLLMSSRRSSMARTAVAAARIAVEVGATTVARRNKLERLRCLSHGVVDGLRGRGGKWTLP